MKKSKTFHEDEDVANPFNWIDDIIWAYTYTTTNRDPAEQESRLGRKVKITIEIYGEIAEDFECAGDYDTSTSKD